MKDIILASASPRRMEIIEMLNIKFSVIVSDIDEYFDANKSIYENVENIAFLKANDVFKNNTDKIIIGADTVVFLDGKKMLKPKDKNEARNMITNLSGKTHSVITGLCVMDSAKIVKTNVETKVTFKNLDKSEIEEYIETSEPYDKAGGYGIQGSESKFISKINGDYFNVVGLSISALYDILKEFK